MANPRDTPTDLRLGQLVGNRWRLQRVLGAGATATVYAAADEVDSTTAAVKLLESEAAHRPEARGRLVREAEVSRMLPHHGVARVLAYDVASPAECYLVMELLEGESFAARLRRTPKPSATELLRLARHLLEVLVVAHDAGVVHRDIKPANLLVLSGDRLKLLDFGIARVLGETSDELAPVAQTRLGMALGTIPYMAPEQAQGDRDAIDGRTDLFGVGAVLFRASTGRHIHTAGTPLELLGLMGRAPAPSLSSVFPDCAPELAAIVDQALRFQAEARYPDARTMLDDVNDVLGGRSPRFAMARLSTANQPTLLREQAMPDLGVGITDAPACSPCVTAAEKRLEGSLIADRYLVEERLGEGGMGTVFKAQHVLMRKGVALKVLHRELTHQPEIVARFEREAVAAARIEHPNVVTAKDFGRLEDGSFYLVLEYVDGVSLRTLLAGGSALPQKRAVGIALQIGCALDAAHQAGIVHRDLKPENVMLLEQPEGGELVKVLDFGIARVQSDDGSESVLTRVGTVFGTPEYMSPEQAAGHQVDSRSDLYAVGILLHEMLVGHSPFGGKGMLAVLTAQLTEPPPELPVACEPQLRSLVQRLLSKDPENRPATAGDLVKELKAIAECLHDPTRPSRASAALLTAAQRARGSSRHGFKRVRQLSTTLWAHLEVLARARLLLGRRRVPAWLVGLWAMAAGVIIGVAPVLLSGGSAGGHERLVGAIRYASEKRGGQLAPVTLRARSGDPAALAALSRLPGAQLGPDHWMALGSGYARRQQHEQSLGAYAHAVARQPTIRHDLQLQRDVRAILRSPAGSRALAFAAQQLGAPGAELIYDFWNSARRSPSADQQALARRALELLESDAVQRSASNALKVLIELQLARTCEQFSDLLPRAAAHADRRAEPILQRLTASRGCGFLGLMDCYPCLRHQRAAVTTALGAARGRNPPPLPSLKMARRSTEARSSIPAR